jgi:hypothetical protein
MAKDAISKRLADAVSSMRSFQDQLDGGSPAWMFDADIEPRDSTFELFGLDPKSPRDRRFLLCLLDDIIFSKGKVGAPKKWSEWGQRPSPDQLKADIATVRVGKSVRKSDREICRTLIEDKHKKFKGRYANIKLEALRYMVRKIK